jgi:hypothetical protein
VPSLPQSEPLTPAVRAHLTPGGGLEPRGRGRSGAPRTTQYVPNPFDLWRVMSTRQRVLAAIAVLILLGMIAWTVIDALRVHPAPRVLAHALILGVVAAAAAAWATGRSIDRSRGTRNKR